MIRPLIAILLCGVSVAASAQSKYSETKYGISFEYPAGYVVEEGPLGAGDNGMVYLGPTPMEFVSPGEVRVVTIQAPDHSYPGTDFNNAFFTVSVHTQMTRNECQRFEDVKAIGASDKKLNLSGIEFQDAPLGFAGLGHQFFGSYYHGFSKGVCYEFGYGVATSGYGAVDGMTQVNSAEVLSLLENVLKTVTIIPPVPGK